MVEIFLLIVFENVPLSLNVPKLQSHVGVFVEFIHPLKWSFTAQMQNRLVYVKDIVLVHPC